MAFFKKLRDKMFKSSDRIGQGLDSLIEEGPAASDAGPAMEPAESLAAPQPAPAPVAPEAVAVRPAPPPVAPLVLPQSARQTAPQAEARPAAPQPVPPAPPKLAPVPQPVTQAPPVRPTPPWPRRRCGHPLSRPRSSSLPAAKPGFFGRLMGQTEVARRVLDDAMLESLEELLIQADMGVDTAARVTANIAEGRSGPPGFDRRDARARWPTEIARIMEPVARPMPIYPKKPQVVLVVGVNGSGKTTTIGKLASQFKAAGKSVVIAAGDTFRAAAVEQLQIWGQRAGVPVLTAPEGSRPGEPGLRCDDQGAGRGRGPADDRHGGAVAEPRRPDGGTGQDRPRDPQEGPDAPHNTLLVLDATTGQNALMQVEIFRKIADVSGLVMTKLDGTAKGGVLVALADKFGLPIHAIGVGEQIDDLAPFDPEEFARALVGLERADVRPRGAGSGDSRPPIRAPRHERLAVSLAGTPEGARLAWGWRCWPRPAACGVRRAAEGAARSLADAAAAIDAQAYGADRAPFALFVVPWPEGQMWPIFAGAFVIHFGYKLCRR